VSLGVAAAFVLAACGGTAPTGSGLDVRACLVSDLAGFDDRSFNQSALEGLERAESELGVEIATAEPVVEADVAVHLEAFVADGCTLVIGVGYLLEPAVREAAEANPEVSFALVDASFFDVDGRPVTLHNAKPLRFDTAQAAFLAGYLAAGVSRTGTVATFGGVRIPSVTVFMDGFVAGAARYGQDDGTPVRTLGWSTGTENGTFVGSFTDHEEGLRLSEDFLAQGADVLFPVAGPVGLSAVAAIRDSGAPALVVGVDTDWSVTVPDAADLVLTSVVKEVGQAVFDTVRQAWEGSFTSDPYLGTLENGGVGLASPHDLGPDVPVALLERVERVRADIVTGKITVTSPSTPR